MTISKKRNSTSWLLWKYSMAIAWLYIQFWILTIFWGSLSSKSRVRRKVWYNSLFVGWRRKMKNCSELPFSQVIFVLKMMSGRPCIPQIPFCLVSNSLISKWQSTHAGNSSVPFYNSKGQYHHTTSWWASFLWSLKQRTTNWSNMANSSSITPKMKILTLSAISKSTTVYPSFLIKKRTLSS